MSIYISWGQIKPPAPLVALMIEKLGAYHVASKTTLRLVYDHRWPNEDGTAADYDGKCWHIRDDAKVSPDSRGLEGAQGLVEGLQDGWLLAMAQPRGKK